MVLKNCMFIWLFHRTSGLILIVLFGMKIFSAYFLYTKDKKPDWALGIHRNPVLDILILVLFTFHSLYGSENDRDRPRLQKGEAALLVIERARLRHIGGPDHSLR